MNSDPLNLTPISRLAGESRASFASCAAVTAEDLPSSRTDLGRWLWTKCLQLMAAGASWRARRTQRSRLAQLDAWTMRDLGLSEADVWRELQKLPWQP